MLGPIVVSKRPAEGRWVSRSTHVQLGVVTHVYNFILRRQWQKDQEWKNILGYIVF